MFIVVDCLRLDQWRVLEPLLAPFFDVETTHYFAVLPTATPYSRNALFSGLFPGEIAARLPDWWGNADREDESLNAHERELLESHLEELCGKTPVRYQKISTASNSDDLERHLGTAIGPEGVSAFVFNFVDLLTHGRSESQILYEVARDEIALRQITRQWFQRSALFSVLKEASRRKISVLLTTDHGSDPLQHSRDGVRQARRQRQSPLQVRRRSARGASGAGAALLERGHAETAAARRRRKYSAGDE